MTTFSSPLYVKTGEALPDTLGGVGGWYTFNVAPSVNGLVMTSTASNQVTAMVIPAGRTIYNYGVAGVGFTGTSVSVVQLHIMLASVTIKSIDITATTANVTPDSPAGAYFNRPLSVDTTLSYYTSCSGGRAPTAGNAWFSLQIG